MAETNRHFHSSEIAMLILGYLKDNHLHKTFSSFLKESKDLEIYWQLLKQGINPDLNICGYDLSSMLEEYAADKLERSDKGEPLLPGPKLKRVLSQPETIKFVTEKEEDKLKQERNKELKRRCNQAYREKQKEIRDLERKETEKKKAEKNLRAAQKASAAQTKAATRASLDEKGLTQNSLLYTSAPASLSQDILQVAVAETGIAQETHEKSSGDANRSEQATISNNDTKVEEDYNFLDQLLDQTHLAERLASYINQGRVIESHQVQDENDGAGKDKSITTIVEQTSVDPAFQDFLSLLQGAPVSDGDMQFSIPALDHNENHTQHSEAFTQANEKDPDRALNRAEPVLKPTEQRTCLSPTENKQPTSLAVQSPMKHLSPEKQICDLKSCTEQCANVQPTQIASSKEISSLGGVESKTKQMSSPCENDKSSSTVKLAKPEEAVGLVQAENISLSADSSQPKKIQVQSFSSLRTQQEKDLGIRDQTCPCTKVSVEQHCEESVDIDVIGDGYNSHSQLQGFVATNASKRSELSPTNVSLKSGAEKAKQIDLGPSTSTGFVVPEENSLSVFSFLEREAAAMLGKKFTQNKQNRVSPVPERMTAMSVREESQVGLHPPAKTTVGSRKRKGLKPTKASLTYINFFSKKQHSQKDAKTVASSMESSYKIIPDAPLNISELNISEERSTEQIFNMKESLPNKSPKGDKDKHLKLQGNERSSDNEPETLACEGVVDKRVLSSSTTSAICASPKQSVPKATSSHSHASEQERICFGNAVSDNAFSSSQKSLENNSVDLFQAEGTKSPPPHDTSQDSEHLDASIKLHNIEIIDKCLEETLNPLVNELTRISSNTQNVITPKPGDTQSIESKNVMEFLPMEWKKKLINREGFSESNVFGLRVARPSSCPNLGSEKHDITAKRVTVSSVSSQSMNASRSKGHLAVPQNIHKAFDCSKSMPAFSKTHLISSQTGGERISEPKRPKPRLSSESEDVKKTVIAFHNESSAFTPSHCFKPPTRRIAPVEVSYNMPSPFRETEFSPVSSVPASTLLSSLPGSVSSRYVHGSHRARTQSPLMDAFSVTLGSPPRCRQQEADSNSPGKLRSATAFSSSSLPASFTNESQGKRDFKPGHLSRSQREAVEGKKKVITFHSNRSAFTPIHCQKRPSRRIAPTEVSSNVPSPLQASPSRSPPSTSAKRNDCVASDNFNVSTNKSCPDSTVSTMINKNPSVVKLAKPSEISEPAANIDSSSSSVANFNERASTSRQVLESDLQEQKSGLSLPSFETLGISLPPSPSRRRPRRVTLTQISGVPSKGLASAGVSSCSRQSWATIASPPFLPDESKIVTSSSDLPPSQSKEEAFKLLKSFIGSYTKPQPQQEITSTNQSHRGSHKKKKSKKPVHVHCVGGNSQEKKETGFSSPVEQKSSNQTSVSSANIMTLSNNEHAKLSISKEDGAGEAAVPSCTSNLNENSTKVPSLGTLCDEKQADAKEVLDSPPTGSSLDSASFAVVGTMEYKSPTPNIGSKATVISDEAQIEQNVSSVRESSVNVAQTEVIDAVSRGPSRRAQTKSGTSAISNSLGDLTQSKCGVTERCDKNEKIASPVSYHNAPPNNSSIALTQGCKVSASLACCAMLSSSYENTEKSFDISVPVSSSISSRPSLTAIVASSDSVPKTVHACEHDSFCLKSKNINLSNCCQIEQRKEETDTTDKTSQMPSNQVPISTDNCSSKSKNKISLDSVSQTKAKKSSIVNRSKSERPHKKAKRDKQEKDKMKKSHCLAPLLPALGAYDATVKNPADQDHNSQSISSAGKYPPILPKGLEGAQSSTHISQRSLATESINSLQSTSVVDKSMSSMRPHLAILSTPPVFTNLSTKQANSSYSTAQMASQVMSVMATLCTLPHPVPTSSSNIRPIHSVKTSSPIIAGEHNPTRETRTQPKAMFAANDAEGKCGSESTTRQISKSKPSSELSLDQCNTKNLRDHQSNQSVSMHQSEKVIEPLSTARQVLDIPSQESSSPIQKVPSTSIYTSLGEMVEPLNVEGTPSLAQGICGKNIVQRMANRRSKKLELGDYALALRQIRSKPQDSTGKFICKPKLGQVPCLKTPKTRQRKKTQTTPFTEIQDRGVCSQNALNVLSNPNHIKKTREHFYQSTSENNKIDFNDTSDTVPSALEPLSNPSPLYTKTPKDASEKVNHNSKAVQKSSSKAVKTKFVKNDREAVPLSSCKASKQDTPICFQENIVAASKKPSLNSPGKNSSPKSGRFPKSKDIRSKDKKLETVIREVAMSPDQAIEVILPGSNSDMISFKDCQEINLSFESRSLLSSPDTPRLTIDFSDDDQEVVGKKHLRNNDRQSRKRKHSQLIGQKRNSGIKARKNDETFLPDSQSVTPHKHVQYSRLESKHSPNSKSSGKDLCPPECAAKIDNGSGDNKRESKSFREPKGKDKKQDKKAKDQKHSDAHVKNMKQGKKKGGTPNLLPPIFRLSEEEINSAATTDRINCGSPTTESQDRQIELEKAVAVLEGCLAAGDATTERAHSGHAQQVYISPVKHLPLKKRHFDFQPATGLSVVSASTPSLAALKSVLNPNGDSMQSLENQDELLSKTQMKLLPETSKKNYSKKSLSLNREHRELHKSPTNVKNLLTLTDTGDHSKCLDFPAAHSTPKHQADPQVRAGLETPMAGASGVDVTIAAGNINQTFTPHNFSANSHSSEGSSSSTQRNFQKVTPSRIQAFLRKLHSKN